MGSGESKGGGGGSERGSGGPRTSANLSSSPPGSDWTYLAPNGLSTSKVTTTANGTHHRGNSGGENGKQSDNLSLVLPPSSERFFGLENVRKCHSLAKQERRENTRE